MSSAEQAEGILSRMIKLIMAVSTDIFRRHHFLPSCWAHLRRSGRVRIGHRALHYCRPFLGVPSACVSLRYVKEADDQCVSVPTAAASAVQLAAAKRAYLCGLLHDGKVSAFCTMPFNYHMFIPEKTSGPTDDQLPNFPKYLSSALSRALEKHLTAYADLGKYYMSANWPKVYEVAGQKVFKEVRFLILASDPAWH